MPDWQPVAGHRHQHLYGRQAGSLGPWQTLTKARLVGSTSYGSCIALRKQPPSVSFTGKAVTPSSTSLQVLELPMCDRSLVPPLTGLVSATDTVLHMINFNHHQCSHYCSGVHIYTLDLKSP